VTVRKNVLKPAERATAKPEIVNVIPALDKSMTKIESIKVVKENAVLLDKTDVIVA
jgi:hypothetical protein